MAPSRRPSRRRGRTDASRSPMEADEFGRGARRGACALRSLLVSVGSADRHPLFSTSSNSLPTTSTLSRHKPQFNHNSFSGAATNIFADLMYDSRGNCSFRYLFPSLWMRPWSGVSPCPDRLRTWRRCARIRRGTRTARPSPVPLCEVPAELPLSRPSPRPDPPAESARDPICYDAASPATAQDAVVAQ